VTSTLSRRGVLAGGALVALAGCSGDDDAGRTGTEVGPQASTDATTTAAETAEASAIDWSRLRRSVRGTLRRPGDPGYDRVRLTQNPRYDAQRPLAVLSVASAKDVATAIRFAQDQDVPVAVRSGGHSYPGWSGGGSPKALVIDVRPLDRVEVHGKKATIGSGAALAHVYDGVSGRGRAIAAGSCPTVGVAGLTLGGGVGVLTRAYGLTCDAVRSMQVVTADAKVRTVDAHHDPDLFWALRGGGGGHLGVVTGFTFKTVAAPVLHTAFLQWPVSAASDVVAAWQAWAPFEDARLWSTCKVLGGRKHASGPVVLVSVTWTGPGSAFEGRLAGLLSHLPRPAVSTRATRTYRQAMFSYAGCSTVPASQCTTGPGGALTREALSATSHVAYDPLNAQGLAALLDQVDDGSGLLEAGISIDALGGRVGDQDAEATAFPHRAALATVQYTATYPPGTPKRADRFVRGFRAAMLPHWGNHAYVNYSDPTIADYQSAYFGANAARLAQVRAAYDPHGFFTQPQGY
jgi:FAD/FMN-containing dehydrogenase